MPLILCKYWDTARELLCKDPSFWEENKMSSGAKDDAKSAAVGTREVGHRSDLNRGRSSVRVEKLWKAKCNIIFRLVKYYALLGIMLCSLLYYVMHSL